MFALLLSAVFSTVGFLASPFLLEFIGAVPGTPEHRLSIGYTRTIFVGIPLGVDFFVLQGLLQGGGDTRTPMYLMSFGLIPNVLVNSFFILGFQDNVLFAWLGITRLEQSLYTTTGFSGRRLYPTAETISVE